MCRVIYEFNRYTHPTTHSRPRSLIYQLAKTTELRALSFFGLWQLSGLRNYIKLAARQPITPSLPD